MKDSNAIDIKIINHGVESIKHNISERNLPSWYLIGIFSDEIKSYLPTLSTITVPNINTDLLPDLSGYMTSVPYSISSAIRFLNYVSDKALNRKCFNRLNRHLDHNYTAWLEPAKLIFQNYQLLNTCFGFNHENMHFTLQNKGVKYDYLLLSAIIITMIENEDYFRRNQISSDMQTVLHHFVKLSCPDDIKVYIYKLLCDSEVFKKYASALYGHLYHEGTVKTLLDGVNKRDIESICNLYSLIEEVGILKREDIFFHLI